jgi:hypothetical protein
VKVPLYYSTFLCVLLISSFEHSIPVAIPQPCERQ